MSFFETLCRFLNEKINTDGLLVLILAIIATTAYLVMLLILYGATNLRLVKENTKQTRNTGYFVVHSFCYSWLKGVSLSATVVKVVKIDTGKNPDIGSDNEKKEDSK